MPKRQRPVDDSDFSGQTKTFVNAKVMSERSTSSDEAMKTVYEKTKRLLWLGSRSAFVDSPFQSLKHPNINHVDQNQLMISKAGQLIKSTHTQEPNHISKGRACSTCREELDDDPPTCSWCFRNTCPHCLRTCHTCSADFCHLCSVLDCRESDERILCFQCKS